jgi:hypothetical protein
LKSDERDVVVGSLAATSVFLNTGLAAFLPLTILSKVSSDSMITIPYPWLMAANNHVQLEILKFGITSPNLLVFFASSMPVLLLGKIVPKIVGLSYPKFFAYTCYAFGALMTNFFGWIALGVLWPVKCFKSN